MIMHVHVVSHAIVLKICKLVAHWSAIVLNLFVIPKRNYF